MNEPVVDLRADWTAYERSRGVGLAGTIDQAAADLFGPQPPSAGTVMAWVKGGLARLSDDGLTGVSTWFSRVACDPRGGPVMVPRPVWTEDGKRVAWGIQVGMLYLGSHGAAPPQLRVIQAIRNEITKAALARGYPDERLPIICKARGCGTKLGQIIGPRASQIADRPLRLVGTARHAPTPEELAVKEAVGRISGWTRYGEPVDVDRLGDEVVLVCARHGEQIYRVADLVAGARRSRGRSSPGGTAQAIL